MKWAINLSELINHCSRKYNNQLKSRSISVQNQGKQSSIPSTTKQLRNVPKSTFTSQMYPKSSRKFVRKDLGHDLDQLTKGNQHEASLSPYPSMTIMVQPNKIDYSERSM